MSWPAERRIDDRWVARLGHVTCQDIPAAEETVMVLIAQVPEGGNGGGAGGGGGSCLGTWKDGGADYQEEKGKESKPMPRGGWWYTAGCMPRCVGAGAAVRRSEIRDRRS